MVIRQMFFPQWLSHQSSARAWMLSTAPLGKPVVVHWNGLSTIWLTLAKGRTHRTIARPRDGGRDKASRNAGQERQEGRNGMER